MIGLRDGIANYVPKWLADNTPEGLSIGFRTLWSYARYADLLIEIVLQGALASVGKGTPTALPLLGTARGVIRGRSETDAQYVARLRKWIERAKSLGTQYAIAREIIEYLGGTVRVRVVSRAGEWLTLDQTGTITYNEAAWNWDSITHPERAGYWSDQWVIVYQTTGAYAPSADIDDGTIGSPEGMGRGHLVPRVDYDAIRRAVASAKAARSRIRAIVWTTDATMFDPTNPDPTEGMPDGTWGDWSYTNADGEQVPSGRNVSTCRFWEPA